MNASGSPDSGSTVQRFNEQVNVFVTGGTGFVGSEIVRQLDAAGHRIRVLVRDHNSPAAQRLIEEFRVEIRQGDILDPDFLPRAMQGADAVIHLVGIISEGGRQTFENVHVQATQNVVQAALISGARRFVHMSALGTKEWAASRYHRTKFAAEQAVERSALDWTVYRPSLIYGRHDKFVNFFARMSRWSPILPDFSDSTVVFQPVSVENVARCFVRCLNERRALNETFNICGPERMTMREIFRIILKVTRRRRLVVRIPAEFSMPLAWSLEVFFDGLLAKQPPLNRDQILMLQQRNTGPARWTTELFKLDHPTFEEGIAKFLRKSKVLRMA